MSKPQTRDDYLEAIYSIRKLTGRCRSIDVAAYLGYSKPSVSVACAKLREAELLGPKSARGELFLTEEGEAIGKKVAMAHEFIGEWLIGLGVDKLAAARDACAIGTHASKTTLEAMRKALG